MGAGTPPPFLRAEWRWMAIASFPVDPDSLRQWIPEGLVLETWDDRAWVSLAGFLFLRPSAFGVPLPFHGRFEEVNLRTYARVDAPGPARRGLVFLGEVVSSPLVALGARVVQNKQYRSARMRHLLEPSPGRVSVEYSWRSGLEWTSLRVEAEGEPSVPQAGSAAEFFTQHYRGFGRSRSGRTLSYEVEHAPWRAWHGAASLRGSVGTLAPPLSALLASEPESAYLVEGSPVLVRRGCPI